MIVAAVVAHPDDEIIGIGGTLLKHIENNDKVYVFILCEGRSSRYESYEDYLKSGEVSSPVETIEALSCLGIEINQLNFFQFKNNRLDTMARLDLIKLIEYEVGQVSPDIIYTHYYDDLNIDHKIISNAVVTAFRPFEGSCVKEILFFETLSSTEYACALHKAFCPNLFVDISQQLEGKLKALSCYKSELRSLPHPRNLVMVKNHCILQGAKIGVRAAECFMVSRIIR